MNKNSKVLALKYRPKTFDDLIGQKIISETIEVLDPKPVFPPLN